MQDARRGNLEIVFAELGSGAWALWRGVRGAPDAMRQPDSLSMRRLARAISDMVWKPLPVVAVLAGLLGVIAGLLSAEVLKRVHAELVVVPMVASLLQSQVAPLLVGVFAAGRVSVALAARLGGMQLEGEIDALRLAGRDPARFLLGPVVASLMIAAPILTVAAGLAASTAAAAALQLDGLVPRTRLVELAVNPTVAAQALRGVARGYLYVLLAVAAGGAAGSAPIADVGSLEERTATAFTAAMVAVFVAAALTVLW